MTANNDNIMPYCNLPEGCQLHIKTFAQLTLDELYALLRTRSEVFIVEQNCVYQDVDNSDQTAFHLWLTRGEKIVAMCRICPRGTKLEEVSVGRVVTTERGRGYGKLIMQVAIDTAKRRIADIACIDIEAQADKRGFYEGLGFKAMSEPFMMEGLPHMHMRLDVVR